MKKHTYAIVTPSKRLGSFHGIVQYETTAYEYPNNKIAWAMKKIIWERHLPKDYSFEIFEDGRFLCHATAY